MSITGGIALHEECNELLQQLKMKNSASNKDKARLRYIIFHVDGDCKQLILYKSGIESGSKATEESAGSKEEQSDHAAQEGQEPSNKSAGEGKPISPMKTEEEQEPSDESAGDEKPISPRRDGGEQVPSDGKQASPKTAREEYEDFFRIFTEPNLPALAVYDMPFMASSGILSSKLVLIHFNADNSQIKKLDMMRRRMVTATALEVMRKFEFGLVIAQESESYLDYTSVIKQLEKRSNQLSS